MFKCQCGKTKNEEGYCDGSHAKKEAAAPNPNETKTK